MTNSSRIRNDKDNLSISLIQGTFLDHMQHTSAGIVHLKFISLDLLRRSLGIQKCGGRTRRKRSQMGLSRSNFVFMRDNDSLVEQKDRDSALFFHSYSNRRTRNISFRETLKRFEKRRQSRYAQSSVWFDEMPTDDVTTAVAHEEKEEEKECRKQPVSEPIFEDLLPFDISPDGNSSSKIIFGGRNGSISFILPEGVEHREAPHHSRKSILKQSSVQNSSTWQKNRTPNIQRNSSRQPRSALASVKKRRKRRIRITMPVRRPRRSSKVQRKTGHVITTSERRLKSTSSLKYTVKRSIPCGSRKNKFECWTLPSRIYSSQVSNPSNHYQLLTHFSHSTVSKTGVISPHS